MLIDSEKLLKRIENHEKRINEGMSNDDDMKKAILICFEIMKASIETVELETRIDEIEKKMKGR